MRLHEREVLAPLLVEHARVPTMPGDSVDGAAKFIPRAYMFTPKVGVVREW